MLRQHLMLRMLVLVLMLVMMLVLMLVLMCKLVVLHNGAHSVRLNEGREGEGVAHMVLMVDFVVFVGMMRVSFNAHMLMLFHKVTFPFTTTFLPFNSGGQSSHSSQTKISSFATTPANQVITNRGDIVREGWFFLGVGPSLFLVLSSSGAEKKAANVNIATGLTTCAFWGIFPKGGINLIFWPLGNVCER